MQKRLRPRRSNHKKNLRALERVSRGDTGQVSYFFDDGTVQVCNVNIEMFTSERGERLPAYIPLNVLKDTCDDRGAEFFQVTC